MEPARLFRSITAAGMIASTLAFPVTSRAQQSGCYKACQIPASSMAVPRYVACLGMRRGGDCMVCPGQQTGQSHQLVADKTLSCFKACAKGFAWKSESQQCCPAEV